MMTRQSCRNLQYHPNGLLKVMQLQISDTIRITYNPDNDRFYVEECEPIYNDWITRGTYQNDQKGWDNAKYRARHLT
jgi:hypothetical protein